MQHWGKYCSGPCMSNVKAVRRKPAWHDHVAGVQWTRDGEAGGEVAGPDHRAPRLG